MSLGHRQVEKQSQMFVAVVDLPSTAGHPFYEKLNAALRAIEFDRKIEASCRKFYDEELGRPGIPPGVYFRMTLVGYFEGIGSDRGIAWRVSDSLSLRHFLGYDLSESTPDHSSMTRIRQRLDTQVHEEVFRLVILALRDAGLLKGKTIGVDATTLEANAAMRSIVRKDTGQSYESYLTELAKSSGIEEPTRSDLAKLDKHRKNKGSNEHWEHPYDKDAKIAKMKDGRTHLAHKAEHVVDLDTGALLGVSLHGCDKGDTQTVIESVERAFEHVSEAIESSGQELPMGRGAGEVARRGDGSGGEGEASEGGCGADDGEILFSEVVTDKGYHSNGSCLAFEELGIRTYLSEPDRGRRRWSGKADAQRAVYANRRRIRGERGKRLRRKRGELVERSNAHMYETGGMRRTHLRSHAKIYKRLIVHAAGFNLGLLLRVTTGIGKPRVLQDMAKRLLAIFLPLLALLAMLTSLLTPRLGFTGSKSGFQNATVVTTGYQ
jgi:transposase